ncbi:MAG: YdbL family protein [Pseudomonadales bacterium]
MKRISLLLTTILLMVASAAFAADLQQAKRDGLVGERADGYLGLVRESVPKDVVDLVKDVNAKRRAEYERIAESNSLTLEQVQALAGRKAIDRTEAGGWILQNGGWQQK